MCEGGVALSIGESTTTGVVGVVATPPAVAPAVLPFADDSSTTSMAPSGTPTVAPTSVGSLGRVVAVAVAVDGSVVVVAGAASPCTDAVAPVIAETGWLSVSVR